MSFASRLREQRKKMGYTQPELAKKLGITKGAIGNYESGISSPRIEIMFKIFEVLQCDANYLFQDEMVDLVEENASPEEMDSVSVSYSSLPSKSVR